MDARMKLVILMVFLPAISMATTTEDFNVTLTSENFNQTEYSSFDFGDNNTEEITQSSEGLPLLQYQDVSSLRVYKGPLPKFPGTTSSPWIALHSPVQMYIPIRNIGKNSPESKDCIQCPRNLIVYLPPHQRSILTPVPAISICSSFAGHSGRVHVAVVSGPRPGQRLYSGRYEIELMVWKAEGPVHSCKYTILVRQKRKTSNSVKTLPCERPEQPSNGIIFCDVNGKKQYPHDSACQILCEENYLVENTTYNSTTIICRNGKWSPQSLVSCIATFCPELPSLTAYGYWSCNVGDSAISFNNGTHCKVSCSKGYIIPTSQLKMNDFVCKPPKWIHTETIPNCTRAHPPKLLHCQNRHMIIRKGHFARITSHLLPKGSTYADSPLKPVCSLQGKDLSKGKHINVCEVTDPELKTTKKCSYRILVEESSEPRPHPGDCKNRTVLANRKGTIHTKPVRFLVKIGEPVRTKILRGDCKPKGEIKIGDHFIVCKATDPHTKSTGTCSYWLKIRKRSCPTLPKIENGHLLCASNDVGSVCNYKCDEGYIFNSNHLPRATKECKTNLKWQPPLKPVCEVKPPELLEGCDNLEAELSSSDNFTIPVPKFITAFNTTLNISCSPSFIYAAGNYLVTCASDDELYNTSCNFNISMQPPVNGNDMSSTSYLSEAPILLEGCNDIEINVSLPTNYTVPQPKFLSPSNETIFASCDPPFITVDGYHEIECTVDNSTYNVSCNFSVDVQKVQDIIFITSTEQTTCNPLSPPLHSSVQCSSVGETETCVITCDPGYGFSEDNTLTVVCIGGPHGLWDYQHFDSNTTLPECLAQEEGSAVEVWISFEAFAPHCDEELEDQIKDVVIELCVMGTNCTRFSINCTLDEESDMMFILVNWTVQADFNDEEYYEGEEIPEAEIRLEAVLEKTRTFLSTDDAPNGIRLFQDSFKRGHITLVCPTGYTPNMLMAKCVQCPPEIHDGC